MMHLHFFLLLLIGEAWSATLKDAGAQNYVQDLDDDSKNRQSDTILVIIESFRTIHERLDMLEKKIENEMDGLHRQLEDSDRKIEKVHNNVERNTKLIQTISNTCSKEHITTARPSTATPATTPKGTCQCTAEYNMSIGGVFVEAYCGIWSSSDFYWCYLSGGSKGKECPGAVKSSAGDFYWTKDEDICRAAESNKKSNWSRRFGNSTYYWSKDQDVTMSWEGAKLWCERMARNSHLAKIETEEENDFLTENFSGYNNWLGANDRHYEGSFRWTDGSPVNFTGWAYNEPNNSGGGEDCVHMFKSKSNKWNDNDCAEKFFFICERED